MHFTLVVTAHEVRPAFVWIVPNLLSRAAPKSQESALVQNVAAVCATTYYGWIQSLRVLALYTKS